jgi:hypothetical protein
MAGSASFGRAAQTVLWLEPHDVKAQMFSTGMGMAAQDYNRTIAISKCRNAGGERKKIAFWFEGTSFRFTERGMVDKKDGKDE